MGDQSSRIAHAQPHPSMKQQAHLGAHRSHPFVLKPPDHNGKSTVTSVWESLPSSGTCQLLDGRQ